MLLSQFFKNAPDIEIKQLSCDSRMPMEDCIFFCVKGIKDDGHSFVKEAINNGAKVIVYEKAIDTSAPCIYIRVNNVLDALNQIAAKFYNYPGKKMENFVVSGSYGRNSVAYIIKQIIDNYRPCGYIGSYGVNYLNTKLLSSEPTLTILENQRHLLMMKESGVEAVVFEATALGLDLKKLDAIYPDAFVYTNTSIFTPDYQKLDQEFANTYIRYLNHFVEPVDVIFNMDDEIYLKVKDALKHNVVTYSLKNEDANFYARDINIMADGTTFILKCYQSTYQVNTNLIGMQNVYNILAAIAALVTRGYPVNEVVALCKNQIPPEGIMDKIDMGQNYHVIVDSCTSYETMSNVLKYARSVVDIKHKIVVLYGMNAYSSKEKRTNFGKLLDMYADIIILTEDDAYEKSVFSISSDIEDGIVDKQAIVIESREDAIYFALELLNQGDMLLCLGKGSEKYMYRSLGKEVYLGDVEITKKYIKKRMEEKDEIS